MQTSKGTSSSASLPFPKPVNTTLPQSKYTTMPQWTPSEAKTAIEKRPPPVVTWHPNPSNESGALSPNLVDSNTVAGTPSIVELARALNNDPNLIYQFVHDNISYYPIYGVQKGAFGALLDGAGTDFDQSMLMVALLRQAGFTANYVLGQIVLSASQVAAWLGTNTTNPSFTNDMLSNGGIPHSYTTNGDGSLNQLTLTHCWVQVNIGGTLYVYDPSMKTRTFQSGIDLGVASGYNRTALLTAAQTGATIDPLGEYVQNLNSPALNAQLATYATNLVSYIKTNMPTATMDNIIGGSQIQPATIPLSQTALPYEMVGDVPTIWTGDIPTNYKITYQVEYGTIFQTFTSDQIYGRRLTIFMNGSNLPILSLDGTVVATSAFITVGAIITVTHNAYPNTNNDVTVYPEFDPNSVGNVCFLSNGFGTSGRGTADYHRNVLAQNLAAGGLAASEPLLGEALAVLWYTYNGELNKSVAVYDGIFSSLPGIETVCHHSVGVVGYNNKAPWFDMESTNSSFNYLTYTPWTITEGAAASLRRIAMEGLVFQQFLGSTGISGPSQIAIQSAAGNKIFYADSSLGNWADIQTNLVNWTVADINYISQVTVQPPFSYLLAQQAGYTIDDWTGATWVVNEPGSFGGYVSPGMIGGGVNSKIVSADTINQKTKPWKKPCKCEGVPISICPGFYTHPTKELYLGGGGENQFFPYKLSIDTTYNSEDIYLNGPLGLGWTHNFVSNVSVNSDGFRGLGEDSPIEAAAAIIAAYALMDLFSISNTQYAMLTVAVANLVEYWAVGQLTNNVVVMTIGGDQSVFYKLADGTYHSPLGNAGTLTLSGGLYTYKTPQQVTYNFNAAGNLTTIVHPAGVTVTLTYTGSNLTSVTNGLGRTLTFSYTGNFLTTVSDGTGRSVSYVVDVNNDLTQFTDENSQVTKYVYGAPGQLTQIFLPQNPLNAAETNVYDTLGRVKTRTDANGNVYNYFFAGSRSQITDPAGNNRVWYFNSSGHMTSFIDQLGNKTTYQYDGLDRLVQETMPEGNYTVWTFDGTNNILTETNVPKSGSGLSNIVSTWTYDATYNRPHTLLDPRGNTWTWNYDPATSNLLSFVKPVVGGQTPQESWTYNGRGQVLLYTDETGVVTQFNYDVATENLLSVVADLGMAPHLNLTTTFGHDSVGNFTSVTDPNNNQTILVFDPGRRLTQTTAPAPFNYVTKYGYDLNDNLTSVQRQVTSTPTYQTYTIAYTLSDQVFTVTDPALNVTTKTYDNLDRLSTVKDAENRLTTFFYDARSYLSSAVDASGKTDDTRLYTNNGLLASIKDANGNQTQYTRDGFDRLDKTTYADASFEENQVYDANSNLLTYRMRSGNTIVGTFDVLNRLATKTPTGQAVVTFGYDLHSRLLSESTPVVGGNPASGNFQFLYDTAGRLKQETTPDSKNTQYQLDANDNLTVLTYPDGYFVTRIYDQLNRLTDIKLNGAGAAAVHVAYDQLSRRSVLTYGNGASSTYTFQLNDDLTALAESFTGSAVTLTYGFNKVGQETNRSPSDGSYLWHPAAAGSVAYAPANNVNQYPTVGGVNYLYDGNANLTSDGVWTYTFDTENHLLTANKTGVSASYVYDPSHRQVQKTVGTAKTRYVYSGWQRIADYDGTANTLQNRYVYGDNLDEPLVQVSSAGVLTYLHADRQGSIIATTDSTGTVTNKSKYSPFGENAPVGTTFGFTGQRYDAETGLYYYKNRYYSPTLNRFLQTDPIGYGAGLNVYAYAGNDPINATDPLGLDSITQTGPSSFNIEVNNAAPYLGPVEPKYGYAPEQKCCSTSDQKKKTGTADDSSAPGGGGSGPGFSPNGTQLPPGGTPSQVLNRLTLEGLAMTLPLGIVFKGRVGFIPGKIEYLYQKLDMNGNHLKFGVTDNLQGRYNAAQLNGGWLVQLTEGTRREMLALERMLHETLPLGSEERQKQYVTKQIQKGLRHPDDYGLNQ